MEIKAKINKWDRIKLEIFCTMKESISKVKRQTSEWEKKIIANETTDKELISKIFTSSSCSSIPEKKKKHTHTHNQKMGQRTK